MSKSWPGASRAVTPTDSALRQTPACAPTTSGNGAASRRAAPRVRPDIEKRPRRTNPVSSLCRSLASYPAAIPAPQLPIRQPPAPASRARVAVIAAAAVSARTNELEPKGEPSLRGPGEYRSLAATTSPSTFPLGGRVSYELAEISDVVARSGSNGRWNRPV